MQRQYKPEQQIAWACGLFEGEGCISVTRQPNPKHPERLYWMRYVGVSSTERETLERFQDAVGMGKVNGPYKNGKRNEKPIYHWKAQGYGEMKRLIAMFYPYLSKTRRAAADVLLAHPPDPNGFRYSRTKLAEFEAIEVPGWNQQTEKAR